MIKKYRSALLLTFFVLFNFAETAYFGFNLVPRNIEEYACDLISMAGMFWALLMAGYDVLGAKRTFVIETKESENSR